MPQQVDPLNQLIVENIAFVLRAVTAAIIALGCFATVDEWKRLLGAFRLTSYRRRGGGCGTRGRQVGSLMIPPGAREHHGAKNLAWRWKLYR